MGLIERLIGVKIVKAKTYATMSENLRSLEQEKIKCELERVQTQDEIDRLQKGMHRVNGELRSCERAKNIAINEMQESMALAESYLKDQKDVEKRYMEVSRLLTERLRNGNGLPNYEKEILFKHFIPSICEIPHNEKILLGSYHTYPRGTDKFLDKASKCPYVREVKRVRTIEHGAKKGTLRIIRESEEERTNGYKIMAVYVNQTGAEVQITTTAKNSIQHEYAYRVLSKDLGID